MAAVQVAGPIGQPDIGYTPDLDKYLARVKRRLNTETLPKSLPSGFPQQLKSDLVWTGDKVGETYDWTYELDAAEIEDIENALAHFKCEYASLLVNWFLIGVSFGQATWVCKSGNVPSAKTATGLA